MLSEQILDAKLKDWPLSWISREKLTQIVATLVKEAQPNDVGLSHKNIVDPFSALFDMSVNHMDYDQWVKAEIRRQQQKTLQNAIGKFHQCVLGSVTGWEDKGVGQIVDLICPSRRIFAEVKNKFNTVKASDKIGLYNTMSLWREAVPEHKKYTGYYVQIIAKEKFDRPFVPSDNKTGSKASTNEHIREIDGASFYELVTGSKTALEDLYAILPFVLQKVCPSFDAATVVAHANFLDFFTRAFAHNK